MPLVNTDETYQNPVCPRSFPDPFVLKYRGDYYAYSTGHAPDGLVFQVLHSEDLVNWCPLGGAMVPLDTGYPFYWAPEVTYHNGKFYLYYSVGNETLMHIRVAVSDRPDGGFVDAGKRLTNEDFAIDAYVFRDDDGAWYMFYATDFLDYTHIGTGTVVDRMLDPFTLAGNPRPVTRAKYDWQVYDPQRKEKGGVRWHTVEGPTVLKRKGKYYEMFSGGNWHNVSYGVSFAVTGDINSDDEWQQYSDGTETLPILRTIPDCVIGPGHNSVIRGPNNRELYCVYHSWVDGERVLSIDRMDFAGGGRLFVAGPTFIPQPVPYAPHFIDKFRSGPASLWRQIAGEWSVTGGDLISVGKGSGEIVCELDANSFVCEVYGRSSDEADRGFGICLRCSSGDTLCFIVDPIRRRVITEWSAGRDPRHIPLPDGFDITVWHLLRVEVDDHAVVFSIDEVGIVISTPVPSVVGSIGLTSAGPGARFSAFTVTYGFEERFENDAIDARGWSLSADSRAVHIADGAMTLVSKDDRQVGISKRVGPGDLELVVNVCLKQFFTADGKISFGCGSPLELSGPGPLTIRLNGKMGSAVAEYQLGEYQQFRLIWRGDTLDCFHEVEHLASFAAKAADRVEVSVTGAEAAVEMVRFTSL